MAQHEDSTHRAATHPRPDSGVPAGAFASKLLVDLVMDPRDPGYEDAAARRNGLPTRRWYDRPATVVGCLVIGFTLAVAYAHTHRGAPEAAKVHSALVSRVRTADSNAANLAATAQRLSTQLNTLRDASLTGSGPLERALNRAQLEAGEVAVTGPGLTVELKEPKAAAPSVAPNGIRANSISAGNILTDRDVQSVVNELWSDGAEAIAVNGIRLTPTSAVRFAGDAVLVDYQPISSPYTISAIGDADLLATSFASSDVASRYQTLESVKGIGFSFDEHAKLALAASPSVTPRYAKVLVTAQPKSAKAPSTHASSGAHK